MCGIGAIIGSCISSSTDLFAKTIAHRGPDSLGTFTDEHLVLYHTRLAIQDLSPAANQPMVSYNGNYVISYNGEIYNHLDIRKELSDKYTFQSTSDTETLLYGYIEFGEEILSKLNGIFAFAIYNKITGDVFIARDQFGVKPLYYYQKEGVFLIGSEIKSFLPLSSFDKTLEPSTFLNHLVFLFSPNDSTPFRNVKKLPPGAYITMNVKDPSAFQIKSYYTLPVTNNTSGSKVKISNEKLLEKELEEKLLQAVERQLLSDVPVGFFLSGGLDSSAIVALAKNLYPQKEIQCFTINSHTEKEGFANDLPYARIVSKHLNVKLEEVNSGLEIIPLFDQMIYHLDEPLADPAAIHVLAISKKARAMGYKVLLSGLGADEIFSGYRRHQAVQLETLYKIIPYSFFNQIAKIIGLISPNDHFRRRIIKLFGENNYDKTERLISYFHWLAISKAKELFSPPFQKELVSYNSNSVFEELLNQLPAKTPDLNRLLYLDLKTYLPGNNLIYTDKMGMANGVEVRVPFLDKDLVDFSFKIPVELKMKGLTTKYLLRKVMSHYLPSEIIHRPKTGFGAPVRSWITNELQDKVQSELNPEKLKLRGIFDPEKVWTLINDNKTGKGDFSYSIWTLLAIGSWMRQFIDGQKQYS